MARNVRVRTVKRGPIPKKVGKKGLKWYKKALKECV